MSFEGEAPAEGENLFDSVAPAPTDPPPPPADEPPPPADEPPPPADEPPPPADEPPAERPEWLPEKFRSPEDLVKAYNELGGKLRERSEPPEQYNITLPGEKEGEFTAVELAENEVKAFKDAGLTNDQAQKLTAFFHEQVVPSLVEARAEIERDRLGLEWGMDTSSNAFTQQLARVKAWAQQNLPEAVVAEMARSANGVKTMARMMEAGAQAHRVTGHASNARPDRAQLESLMNDDRYWSGDETYREYVRKQFQAAYD